MVPRPCEVEGCGNSPPMCECFSFIVSMQHYHLEQKRYSFIQCEDEQHFACSHEHAVALAHTCVHEHHDRDALVERPGVAFRLPDGSTCALCGDPLDREAYSIAVCYAMPGRGYSAFVCGVQEHIESGREGQPHVLVRAPEQHWCCSEAHAKEAAEACIEEHLSLGPHGCCTDPDHEHDAISSGKEMTKSG
jgi:hypothetical protein